MVDAAMPLFSMVMRVRKLDALLKEVSLNVNQLCHAAQMSLVDIRVAAGTLEPSARKMLEGIRISSKQASQMVRSSFSGLKGAAGSWELLLALGGLYLLSDSLGKNLKKAEIAEKEITSTSTEALLGLLSSSMGILGGGVEILGLTIKNASQNRVNLGAKIVRSGAILGASAGLFDTFQAIISAKRSGTSGDIDSRNFYYTAAALSGGATVAAILGAFNPLLFGPIGIAISLTLIAYYSSKYAEESESTPLERWIKRCHFGKANETPKTHWNTPEFSDIAFAELNAATLGLSGTLSFEFFTDDRAHRPQNWWPCKFRTKKKDTLSV
ncbi:MULTISPECIES: hypothetical protein [unclassified Pseudomonas]|uniref:hypothetical protein n=1 Tax=unclassified Pseudomonas TaxID=196821 RepID=UPI00382F7003